MPGCRSWAAARASRTNRWASCSEARCPLWGILMATSAVQLGIAGEPDGAEGPGAHLLDQLELAQPAVLDDLGPRPLLVEAEGGAAGGAEDLALGILGRLEGGLTVGAEDLHDGGSVGSVSNDLVIHVVVSPAANSGASSVPAMALHPRSAPIRPGWPMPAAGHRD